MRRVLLVATVLFGLSVGSANAWKPGEKTALRHCAHGRVLSCIHRATLHYGLDYGYMKGVAWCESRWKPWAANGQYLGLYQFGSPLWSDTPYRWHSRYSAKWSALAAANEFARGNGPSNWSCA